MKRIAKKEHPLANNALTKTQNKTRKYKGMYW